VPLAHLGAEGQLSEKVIVRAHDLQVLISTQVVRPSSL
jgi:hypothetical protein